MQIVGGLELLTSAEAALYLRIKERKLYELVATAAIPCTKVTGRWLFPRGDLDRWLLSGMARPLGVVPADPPPIVGGSHDPLLQWALMECGSGLASLPEGSERGYRRFLRGEVIAAAIHFHDIDDQETDANVAVVAREPTLYDAVLVHICTREHGLLVARGNPKKVTNVRVLAQGRLRIAIRPEGAGAQLLLEVLLKREGLTSQNLGKAFLAATGPDVAAAIRNGHADCGVASRAVATAADLDFIALGSERFDLLMRQRDSYREPLSKLLGFLRAKAFAARAKELGGIDVARSGQVRWAP